MKTSFGAARIALPLLLCLVTPARGQEKAKPAPLPPPATDIFLFATLGEFDELKARGIPKTGAPNIGGTIVTDGGLVFVAATNDRKFRAFDRDTGEELWTASLPASGFATPATYLGPKSGRQFVVIAAGGGNKYDKVFSGKIVAFALPAAAVKAK